MIELFPTHCISKTAACNEQSARSRGSYGKMGDSEQSITISYFYGTEWAIRLLVHHITDCDSFILALGEDTIDCLLRSYSVWKVILILLIFIGVSSPAVQ